MLGLERIGVQSRFILLMLLVSLGSILAIGWVGYQSAHSAITYAVNNHLQSVRHAKTSGLLAMLESLRDQVVALSDGKLAAEAMAGFRQAYRGLSDETLTPEQEQALRDYYANDYLPALRETLGGNPQTAQYLPDEPAQRYLQYHYVAKPTDVANPTDAPATDVPAQATTPASTGDDSLYSRTHAAVHERLERLGTLFGYEDILLIDDDTLEIVYTLRKRPDFATNLRNGPYASTNLARRSQSWHATATAIPSRSSIPSSIALIWADQWASCSPLSSTGRR